MSQEKECPICKSLAHNQLDMERYLSFFSCPVCGRYELSIWDDKIPFNKNHLGAYLAYHKYQNENFIEYRYNTVLDKEKCDEYKKEFQEGKNTHGLPVHMDDDMVEAWYPRTFADRIDYILLYLNGNIHHVGQRITLSLQELISMLFVDRFDIDSQKYALKYGNAEKRELEECVSEVEYMLKYLEEVGYIEYYSGPTAEDTTDIAITPFGYKRIDELQKNSSYGKSVLVAMKFGEDTIKLREAIRKGISDADYIAIFIDEVQHNDFITPELLKHIRDSKFVVVDLTHQNNGAYFEEGYAMGIGKPVIQLCQKDTRLHFDIAQKNTIMWDTEDDIPERLTNRIRATID